MNNKRTKGENVYQLVQKRLKFLFNEFDNIYVSFSGGKDSGVLLNLCIQYIREHNLDRKIGVYHMDYEAQYQMTTEYVEQTFRENQDILENLPCLCSFQSSDLCFYVSNLLAPLGRKYARPLGKAYA